MTLNPLAFMSFGFTEILVVGVVGILVFGGRLPEVMRNVGQAYAKLRQGLHEISKPVRDELREVTDIASPTAMARHTNPAPATSGPKDQDDVLPRVNDDADDSAAAKPKRKSAAWMDDEPPPV